MDRNTPLPYGSMLHIPPTNCLLLTAKQEPYKKAYLLTKNIEEFSGNMEVCSRSQDQHMKRTVRALAACAFETKKHHQSWKIRR